jgi:hypothetical protein
LLNPVSSSHALAGTRGVSRTLSRLRPRKFGFVDHTGVSVTSISSTLATSSASTACASEKMRALADTVDRLREIGVAAQSYMFQRALDEVLTGVLVEEAGRLRDQLPRRDG